MPRAIEDYICASEDRSHYDNEYYSSYEEQYIEYEEQYQYISYNKPPAMPPAVTNEMRRKNLERKIKELIKNQMTDLITEDMNINIDLDYEQLRNKPTVNGVSLIGELSKYLDNLKLNDLERILREEGI